MEVVGQGITSEQIRAYQEKEISSIEPHDF